MKLRALTPLALSVLLVGSAASQDAQKPEPVTLATAQSDFARADRDGDGNLSPQEAVSLGFDARAFAQADLNGSKTLPEREFLLAYPGVLVQAGKPVAQDLSAKSKEISIELDRRRQQATKGKGEGGKGDTGAGSGDGEAQPGDPAGKTSAKVIEARGQEAMDELNAELRERGASKETARKNQAQLKQRIDNAAAQKKAGAAAGAGAGDSGAGAGQGATPATGSAQNGQTASPLPAQTNRVPAAGKVPAGGVVTPAVQTGKQPAPGAQGAGQPERRAQPARKRTAATGEKTPAQGADAQGKPSQRPRQGGAGSTPGAKDAGSDPKQTPPPRPRGGGGQAGQGGAADKPANRVPPRSSLLAQRAREARADLDRRLSERSEFLRPASAKRRGGAKGVVRPAAAKGASARGAKGPAKAVATKPIAK